MSFIEKNKITNIDYKEKIMGFWKKAKKRFATLFPLFILLIIISFIHSGKNLGIAIKDNSTVLLMLLPFMILFFMLWILEILTFKYLLKSISVFITILFFIFLNTEKNISKEIVIYTTSNYNCNIASSTPELLKEEGVTLGYYITDIYTENVGFLYKKCGKETYIAIQKGIYDMEYSNSVTRIIESLLSQLSNPDLNQSTHKTIDEYKKTVIFFANKINDEFCSLTCKSATFRNQ